MTTRMEKEFGLLALTDIVWNHTAENSDWLQDHPEAGYNLHNSPHLIAAYQLDTALLDFSSNLRHLGYPTAINTMDDLLKIMEGVKTHVLGSLRLWEFYILDVAPLNTEHSQHMEAGRLSQDEYQCDFSPMSLKERAAMVASRGLLRISWRAISEKLLDPVSALLTSFTSLGSITIQRSIMRNVRSPIFSTKSIYPSTKNSTLIAKLFSRIFSIDASMSDWI